MREVLLEPTGRDFFSAGPVAQPAVPMAVVRRGSGPPGLDKLLKLLPTYDPLAVLEPHFETLASQAQLAPAAVDPLPAQGTVMERASAGLAPAEPPEIVLRMS
ncbi:MAG: hypothetical protein QOI57_27 [Rubrobacteraceae bacterium]|nr:hypothetical protein [Rubrobacteraceae bacterium]